MTLTRWSIEPEEPGCGECAAQFKAVEDADGEFVKWADIDPDMPVTKAAGTMSEAEFIHVTQREAFQRFGRDGRQRVLEGLGRLAAPHP